MSNTKYPHLFSPITLGKTIFRNRIFAGPSGYRLTTYDNIMPEEGFQYYRRKAMGGCGAVASGQFIVDSEYGLGLPNDICIDDPLTSIPLGKLAYAIARYGAVPVAELSHVGMHANSNSAVAGSGTLREGGAYGPVEMELRGRMIMPADDAAIERIITRFADAAAMAKKYGYGMILIHAGHGWGLHQWLSPSINTRTDKWGGPDIENRARIVVAVCDACRKAVGPGFPIEIRISGSECHKGGYDVEEGVKIAKQLEGHVDLIHVSAGNHEVPEVFTVTHPTMFLGDCCNVKYAKEIKKNVKTAVATIGAIGEAEEMEEIIASGTADVVELVRSLIADPDLPNKIRTGREDEIKVCLRCLNCFSKQQSHGVKYCAVNPESGHEHETLYAAAQYGPRKKVLVAGGGIAGMELALTAARLGHTVTICEKKDRLGGAIRCEQNVPFKHKLEEYIENQISCLKKAGVEIRLNTEVTPEFAEKFGADVVVAALGARPVKPPIPGIDGANVIGAEDAYVHPEKVGKTAVVLGGGLVGDELALYLTMLGRKVEIVEMMDTINDGGNYLHTLGLKNEMNKYNMTINFNTKAVEITDKGVRCETPDGERFFEAESVIYAVGQRPLREEAYALNFCAPEFYAVGDCITPQNIPAATGPAHDIAVNLGRV